LMMNGYKAVDGEVVLDWPGYDLPHPAPPEGNLEIRLEWSGGRGKLPNLKVEAVREGERVGVCESVSRGEFTDADAAQDGAFVSWLWVHEELRAQGWGRYLLQRGLSEMRRAGYRNASNSTDWNNHRALLFYSNYGFQMADWTYCYEKRFGEGEAQPGAGAAG
jgi:ribosomal protein S18 acetylase RimI-like enzyme